MRETKIHKKFDDMITMMLKHYNCRFGFGINSKNPYVVRDSKKCVCKAFYHFDYENNEIHSSYWNNKKWNSNIINL